MTPSCRRSATPSSMRMTSESFLIEQLVGLFGLADSVLWYVQNRTTLSLSLSLSLSVSLSLSLSLSSASTRCHTSSAAQAGRRVASRNSPAAMSDLVRKGCFSIQLFPPLPGAMMGFEDSASNHLASRRGFGYICIVIGWRRGADKSGSRFVGTRIQQHKNLMPHH
jgi:hypothetical protein